MCKKKNMQMHMNYIYVYNLGIYIYIPADKKLFFLESFEECVRGVWRGMQVKFRNPF